MIGFFFVEVALLDGEIVGVIGAGVIGVGVAQTLAQTHHRVILIDVATEILERAQAEIYNNVRLGRLYGPATEQASPADVLAHITLTLDYHLLQDAALVIENATEKWAVKQAIYPQLEACCAAPCVFIANTSCFSITRLGALTRRPDRVIGIHFMNPVPLKSTVEVIRGYHTSEATLTRAQTLLTRLGKEWITVQDSPGFVSNRVLMLTINEAIYLAQEQVATPAEIDQVFVKCFGHPLGPLATADLIGLDTILNSIQVLYESFSDSKYRPCPLLKKMVDAGLHGRKNGQGFYKY